MSKASLAFVFCGARLTASLSALAASCHDSQRLWHSCLASTDLSSPCFVQLQSLGNELNCTGFVLSKRHLNRFDEQERVQLLLGVGDQPGGKDLMVHVGQVALEAVAAGLCHDAGATDTFQLQDS